MKVVKYIKFTIKFCLFIGLLLIIAYYYPVNYFGQHDSNERITRRILMDVKFMIREFNKVSNKTGNKIIFNASDIEECLKDEKYQFLPLEVRQYKSGDAWGNELHILEENLLIVSAGKDQKYNTNDDIRYCYGDLFFDKENFIQKFLNKKDRYGNTLLLNSFLNSSYTFDELRKLINYGEMVSAVDKNGLSIIDHFKKIYWRKRSINKKEENKFLNFLEEKYLAEQSSKGFDNLNSQKKK